MFLKVPEIKSVFFLYWFRQFYLNFFHKKGGENLCKLSELIQKILCDFWKLQKHLVKLSLKRC